MDQRPRSSCPRNVTLARLAFCSLLVLSCSQLLAASPGITLVQHKTKDAGSNTTASVNFSSPNTAGNFIAVAIRGGQSSSQVFTVNDSNGNSYKEAAQIGLTGSTLTSAIFYAENIKGGANTVKVSMTVNAPLRFAILEYSGVATSNSLDTTSAATGTGTAVSSGNTPTTVNGDLLLGSVSTVNGATLTAGTGYVIRDSVPNGSGAKLITEDQIQAAAGISSATATLAASDTWGALLAAFKPVGGVSVVPSITSLSPTSGPVGSSVTITGTNFGASQGTSKLTFNGTAATPSSWSATSIVAPVPSGATMGNVVVTVGPWVSNGDAFTVLVPPNITGLSPASGAVSTSVTISGTNFGASQGNSTVNFNGVAATPTSWSATSIVVPVPGGATTGNVVVTVSGLASNGVAFTVAPSITNLAPSAGPAGTSVTITGTNFGPSQGTSSVTFGSSAAAVTNWSNTSIVAIVPGNLSAFTNVAVKVVASGLASNAVNFAIAPSITSISPTSGPAGTSITITGTNFTSTQGSSTVTFNGTAATPTSWSATSIVVPVPSGAATGNVVVTVSGLVSNGVPFTVLVSPSITSLSPTSGPVGTSVTITGTNFGASQGTSSVTFSGTAAAPTSWSATSIVVPVPSGAATGNVIVNVSGLASNGVPFTVLVPPSISSLSPAAGPVGASVTIAGSNFGTSQGSSTVIFNGTAATPTSWNATSIVVPVPSGAATGNVVVTVSGLASNGAPFTVLVPPSISSLSPASGPVGASVTIAGSNFGTSQGSSTVTFNGTAASSTSWSASSIVVVVPNGASSGNVVVTVGGLASNGVAFTVGPSISSLSPASGPAGTSVTITGTNFGPTQGTSSVMFGSSTATVTSWSDTSVVATVPSDLSPFTFVGVKVVVFGVASNTALFSISPNISNLSPTSGPVGTSVTITGTNFVASQGSSTVTFNGTAATPTSWSATSIVVPVPNGATTGNVVVTVSGLTSNGVSFTVLPTPSITGLNPTSGPLGTSVTITGTNFGASQGASTVTFNGVNGGSTSWSNSSITTQVPTGATSGNVVVTVSGVASNGVAFTVTAPVINLLSPTSGGFQTPVTIGGAGFGFSQGSSTVSFAGTLATPTSWNMTSITVPVPTGAISGNVVVTVGGLPSNGLSFTVIPISVSVSPSSATVTTNQAVSYAATVQGDTANLGVTWSLTGAGCSGSACGVLGPATSNHTTSYTAPPAVPNPPSVTITATSVADPTKSATSTVTIVPPAPSITGLSPTSGPINTLVTITGSGFGASQQTSTVTFNGTLASPASWSATSIVVAVPSGATTGNVVVTVSGLASNGAPFTVIPISVSVSPSAVTLGTGAVQNFSATVQNDSQGNGVTWSLSGSGCTGASCGTIKPNIAAPGEIYTAPATAPNPNTVTLTATSVTDPTKSASATITVVQATAPAISSLNPSAGPLGASVTITGTNFGATQGSSVVWFNSTQGAVTTWSDMSIVATVPTSLSGNANALVQVVVLGLASNQANFSITPAPFITSLNPATGPVGSSVTITGANFGTAQGSSTVTFNGAPATPTSWSATSIVVSVPTGATTGNILVTLAGVASNGLTFTVGPDTTPPTAPSSLTATASSAGEIDLYWTASTDNVGVSGYQVERCQGAGCTNFTLFTTLPEPNVSTSLSDVSVIGSTSYSYRVRATDAAGNLSAYSNTVSATTPGAASITSLNPVSGAVGTSVTITGTGFGPGQTNSTVTFNGTAVFPATSWSNTSIVVPVPSGATTGNVVVTVGSLPSNGVNFTVIPPPPPPTITALSPSSAVVGGAPLTLTVNGTNFVSSSTVQWNGNALATTFLSSTQLQATVTSSNIASIGAAKVTVSNASVGGGVSTPSTFFVGTTGGSNFAATVVNQSAQDIVYDPTNQVFYLSVPGTVSNNPNTIAVLDPTFAAITSAQPAGNNPNVLAISDDSQYLYAGIDGTSTVQRFILPGLTQDISYALGSNSFGPFFALDLQVAPGAPHTTAVSLGNSGVSPTAQGGITIFDNATPRASNAPGGLHLFSSIQWGSDGSALSAANNESSGFDFYTLSATSSGVSLANDYPNAFSSYNNRIHFDPGTKFVYSDDGHIIDPTTGRSVGTFAAFGPMAPDSTLNLAFFSFPSQGSTATIQSYDLTLFTGVSSITIPGITGNPLRLVRWGQNGLAFNTDSGQIVLVGGSFVH